MAPTLEFSPLGGLYDSPLEVSLSAGEGAVIYYTLDGSSPGAGSNRYKKPINVTDVSVIRAIAYKSGKKSNTITQTYICNRSYDLAVVSIATNPDNLWDFERGIYVKGCCADTIEPYLGANFWKDWEKPANIEMYDESGELCFNQSVGINLFGGFSRMLPQKSLAIFARSRYGEKRFKYAIFEDRDSEKYKSFILRNSGGDFLRTHLRDAFMTQLAKPTGIAIQEYRPAVVFINGEYWGIQNIREKISEHYLHANFDVDKNNVDILRHNGVKRHGYSTEYKRLLAYLRNNDLSDNTKMNHLKTFLSIEDYIRYNIAEVYSDNRDAGGNIRYWKERTDSSKWRWVLYDLDLGLGNNNANGYKRNTLKKFTTANTESWPDPAWSTFIIRKLLTNKEVERQYINTFADQLNTIYHPDTALRLLNKMELRIDFEMEFHQKRWGSSYQNWKHHMSILKEFIALRPFYIRQHIMQKFDIKDTVQVSIEHPGSDICDIKFNSLEIDSNYEGVYFKNIGVDIEVIPSHDYEFIGWKNDESIELIRTIVPTKNLNLVPILKPKRKSLFSDSIIFNEILFCQSKEDSMADWVELFNKSAQSIDLGGWGFTDRDYKKRFVVENGVIIEPGEFLVLAQNLNQFRQLYKGDSIAVVGDFDFGLSSKGETLKLYDNQGFIVDSLTYFDVEKRDSLFSISLIDPDSSGLNFNNWRIESPTPSFMSRSYSVYLKNEADKKYWTRVFYIGGGSFFFILVSGLLFYRSFKKRKKIEALNP